MNINTNNTTNVLITSSIVFSLIIGFTSMTMTYGEKFELTPDLLMRFDSMDGTTQYYKCPNDDSKTFAIDISNPFLSMESVNATQAVDCGEKTGQQILDESAAQFEQDINDLKDKSD